MILIFPRLKGQFRSGVSLMESGVLAEHKYWKQGITVSPAMSKS